MSNSIYEKCIGHTTARMTGGEIHGRNPNLIGSASVLAEL